jgi:hypothetical protein
MRCLRDRVGYRQIAPEFALLAISVDHGIPAYAIVCGGSIGGKARSRKMRSSSIRLLSEIGAPVRIAASWPTPGVDIVGDDGLFQPAEIANARAAGKKPNNEDG